MPLQFQDATSPGGLGYMLLEASGVIDLEDAQAFEARLHTHRSHHNGYILSRVAKGTQYSSDARRLFLKMRGVYTASASVVTSPVARAAINLMVRFGGGTQDARMFTDEDEALAWLESWARSSSLIR